MQEPNFFTVKDVPASDFIHAYANFLKKNNKLVIPKWADFVKTGIASELAPYDEDWIYIRVASLARKIFLRPKLGVGTLEHIYGGKKRNGTTSPYHEHGSGKIIRWGLAQLEKIGVVKKDKKDKTKKNSRTISKEGQTDLNRIASEVALLNKKK